MNFVDAAVVLLSESSSPLHVEELCRLAVERELLDSPGTNPLRSFKGRLTTELKRGAESRVARVEDDVWTLSKSTRAGLGEAAAPVALPVAEVAAAVADEIVGEIEEVAAEEPVEVVGEDEPPAPPLSAGGGASGPLPGEPLGVRQLTPEEEELSALYGDETGTAQVGQLTEYRDALTADEDRPMVPEMTGERRGRREREDWKARRERMREERRRRREARGGAPATPGAAPAASGAALASGAAGSRAAAALATAAVVEPSVSAPELSGSLAQRACEVLASVKGSQPVPVKQLAQMMRKRRLLEEDPDRVWRSLKAALLADTQRRAAAGLPPRVVYRGRDLFAYSPSANAELEAAEGGLEAAVARLRGATERAMAARLADQPLALLEQIAYLYLAQIGWTEIEWIKRVDRSGYAVGREPLSGQQALIGVRAGNQPVDRRGVGELRAGIDAKNLGRGLLLAPRELGLEARAELDRDGRPIHALCGLPLAVALVGAGVAVTLRTIPVAYLDTDLLDRLRES